MKKLIFTSIVTLTLLSLALDACSASPTVPTATPVDVSAIQTSVMETIAARLTLNAPTHTPTPTITPTSTMTSTPTITPTSTPVHLDLENNIAIYMINVENQDECKYYTFPIPINRGISGDMITDMTSALNALLNTKWTYSGILSNPLNIASMSVNSIEVSGSNLRVNLDGSITPYDDPCLNAEARDQLWATVSRYADSSINSIEIWVDINLFDDIMVPG